MPIVEKLLTGRPEFVFVGEHPAVDFANTFLMVDGEGTDLLVTWEDIIGWLSLARLQVNEGLEIPVARQPEALKKVVELRNCWNAELAQLDSGGKTSDEFVDRLNRLLANDTFEERLAWEGKKSLRLVRSVSRLRGEKLVLAILGRQIAVFLAEANLSHLHRCANSMTCTLYFYDTTKNHRRQWCSVATCGNRYKVAQFRKRQVEAKR
jgi:predicted RNA-binding Zn ribbon-like protein